jgi:hypothetical protein
MHRAFKVLAPPIASGQSVEIRSPIISPDEQRGRGRPAEPPKFRISNTDGHYSVWLFITSRNKRYCCALDAEEVRQVKTLSFAECGDFLLPIISGRERTEKTAARIDALLPTLRDVIGQARQIERQTAAGQDREARL